MTSTSGRDMARFGGLVLMLSAVWFGYATWAMDHGASADEETPLELPRSIGRRHRHHPMTFGIQQSAGAVGLVVGGVMFLSGWVWHLRNDFDLRG